MAVLFAVFALFPIFYAIITPSLTPKEKALVDKSLRTSATLHSVRTMVDLASSAEVLIAESLRARYFASPKHVASVVGRTDSQVARRLIHVYVSIEKADLAKVFATAFLADPTATVTAGIDLVVAAKAEAERLVNSDTIRYEEVTSLAETMQLCVAAALRACSGHDDLIDGVLSSTDGMRALDVATRGNCRLLLGLPEVQRFLDYMWNGSILVHREDWKAEHSVREAMTDVSATEIDAEIDAPVLEADPATRGAVADGSALRGRPAIRAARRAAHAPSASASAGFSPVAVASGDSSPPPSPPSIAYADPRTLPPLPKEDAPTATRSRTAASCASTFSSLATAASRGVTDASLSAAALVTDASASVARAAPPLFFKGAATREQEKKEELIESKIDAMRAAAERFDRDGDGVISMSEVFQYYLRHYRPFFVWPLHVLVLPLVALFPPLEEIGRRSNSPIVRLFNMPPGLRFWAFEVMNIVFASLSTFTKLPIHRFEAVEWRDWLLIVWAFASFVKEIEFVLARGVVEYMLNPHMVIGLIASVCSCAAFALNACNGEMLKSMGLGWPEVEHGERPSADISHMFGVWQSSTFARGRAAHAPRDYGSSHPIPLLLAQAATTRLPHSLHVKYTQSPSSFAGSIRCLASPRATRSMVHSCSSCGQWSRILSSSLCLRCLPHPYAPCTLAADAPAAVALAAHLAPKAQHRACSRPSFTQPRRACTLRGSFGSSYHGACSIGCSSAKTTASLGTTTRTATLVASTGPSKTPPP